MTAAPDRKGRSPMKQMKQPHKTTIAGVLTLCLILCVLTFTVRAYEPLDAAEPEKTAAPTTAAAIPNEPTTGAPVPSTTGTLEPPISYAPAPPTTEAPVPPTTESEAPNTTAPYDPVEPEPAITRIDVTMRRPLLQGIDSEQLIWLENEEAEPTVYDYFTLSSDDIGHLIDVTVTIKTGETISGEWWKIRERVNKLTGMSYSKAYIETDQNAPDNIWQPGEHRCTLYAFGHTVDFTVTVAENPIKDISVTSTREYYQGIDSYRVAVIPARGAASPARNAGGTDDAVVWQERYQLDLDSVEVTIRFKDGDTVTVPCEGVESTLQAILGVEKEFPIDIETYQNSTSWHLGPNRCTLRLMGVKTVFYVTVVDPIKSVQVKSLRDYYFEFDFRQKGASVKDGGKKTDGGDGSRILRRRDAKMVRVDASDRQNVADQTPAVKPAKAGNYDCFVLDDHFIQVTVTFADGEVITAHYDEIADLAAKKLGRGYLNITLDTHQSEENVWQLGANTATLRFLGRDTDFDVTVAPHPVQSISVESRRDYTADVELTPEWYYPKAEKTANAENQDLWGTPTDAAPDRYMRYRYNVDPDATVVTLLLTDGTTLTDTCTNIADRVYEKLGLRQDDPAVETYQYTGKNVAWQPGCNTCTLRYLLKEADFEVTLKESPIVSVTAQPARDLIRGWDQYAWLTLEATTTDADAASFSYGEFPLYIDDFRMTVTLRDGTTLQGAPDEVMAQLYRAYAPEMAADRYADVYFETDQDYSNHIWDVGTHICTLYAMGRDLPVEMNVVENPIRELTAVCNRTYYEGIDKKDRRSVDVKQDLDLTITMKDGTVFRGTWQQIVPALKDAYGSAGVNEPHIANLLSAAAPTDATPTDPVPASPYRERSWQLGKNRCTLVLLGNSADFDAELSPTPIAEITAEQVKPVYRGLDGGITDGYGFRYDYSDALVITVRFNDGRPSVTGTLEQINEKTGYRFAFTDNQDAWDWQELNNIKTSIDTDWAYVFRVDITDAPDGVYGPGDTDGDGKVTSADARLALRASVRLENFLNGSGKALASDVNHDGKIGSDDARLILRASVGLETLA